MKKITAIIIAISLLYGPLFGQWAGVLSANRSSTPASTPVVLTSSYANRSGSYHVGFAFTVGASNITATDLGRFIPVTGSVSRTITIYNFNSLVEYGTVVSVTVNTAGASVNTYLYGSATPPVLTSGTRYIIASDEKADTLNWADLTSITYTSAINSVNSVYNADPVPLYAGWQVGSSDSSYAGVNFKYY